MRRQKIESRHMQIAGTLTPQQYRQSEARKAILAELIQTGEQAKSIKSFADELLGQIEEEALAALISPTRSLQDVQSLYKCALMFVNRINGAIAMGEAKREKLDEISKEK